MTEATAVNFRPLELLERLRCGQTIKTEREAGKTTALLMLAHEIGKDKCVIVFPDEGLVDYAERVWKRLFGQEPAPSFIPARDAYLATRGRRVLVLVDEITHCPELRSDLRDLQVFAATYS
jgi:hypothetical protein